MKPKHYKSFKEECQRYNIDADMYNVYLQISWKNLRELYFKYTRLESKSKKGGN
jgi:hypothetical protein